MVTDLPTLSEVVPLSHPNSKLALYNRPCLPTNYYLHGQHRAESALFESRTGCTVRCQQVHHYSMCAMHLAYLLYQTSEWVSLLLVIDGEASITGTESLAVIDSLAQVYTSSRETQTTNTLAWVMRPGSV